MRALLARVFPLITPCPHPLGSSSVKLTNDASLSSLLFSEPTMLENFSRTMWNYSPSVRVLTIAPSPPQALRPVSFGGFMGPAQPVSSAATPEDMFLGEGEDDLSRLGRGLTSYPSDASDEGEPITWARWDTLTCLGREDMYVYYITTFGDSLI